MFFIVNVAVCFLLPINGKVFNLIGLDIKLNLLPMSLGLVFLLSFFTSTSKFKVVLKNKFFKLFSIFFLMYVVSTIFSVEKELVFDIVIQKASFIVIPIAIFSNAAFYVRKAPQLFKAFFVGVLFTLVVLDFSGILLYFTEGNFPMYVAYSKVFHPTYVGLNIVLLMLMNLYRFGEDELTWKKYMFHMLFLFFLLFHLFVLLSKGVIIVTGISMVIYLFVLMQKHIKKGFAYLSFWLLPVIIFFAVSFSNKEFHDSVIGRFSELSTYNQGTGSTGFRANLIKQAPAILEKHWVFGVGHGTETVHLNSFYQTIGWEHARYYSFNTHNQFLQTWLGIGIAGLFLFCTLMFGPFMLSIDPVVKIMLFCFVFLFCTEAMLERQAGITLFVFFYCLFIGLTRPRQMKARKRVLTFS